ncbi:hypothetical protein [Methanoregula sp.]|uniref:hypothetical protein n=1 Tax=Methanoregula sp. TaxID=2052170 RepID=UPI003C76E1D6
MSFPKSPRAIRKDYFLFHQLTDILQRLLVIDDINSGAPEALPLREVIEGELSAVKKTRAELMPHRGPRGIQFLTLAACILINIIFFLTRSDYFGVFIAASFYLNMYYFITLIIPTNFNKTNPSAADLSRFQAWLKEIGVTSGATQFTRLFINSLFINSRALSLGIGLIFSIDIVFTVIDYFGEGLPLRTTAIVIFQCAVIVTFYLLVWKIEPFSTTYIKKVEGVKRSLHRQKLPPQLITGMFIFGFLTAIFLFLVTIIWLPGVTLQAFLNYSQLTELGHLFALVAILAISQYFIIRYIHGITSRSMAERLFDFKETALTDLLDMDMTASPGIPNPAESPFETSKLLLETKIFIVKRKTIGGTFPVFIVDLDFSVMLDNTTLTAIRGYIIEKKQ